MIKKRRKIPLNIRIPEEMENKVFSSIGEEYNKTDISIIAINASFAFLKLFNKIVENCPVNIKAKLIKGSMDQIGENERGVIIEFSRIFGK